MLIMTSNQWDKRALDRQLSFKTISHCYWLNLSKINASFFFRFSFQ